MLKIYLYNLEYILFYFPIKNEFSEIKSIKLEGSFLSQNWKKMCIVQQHETSEPGFRFNIQDVFSRTYIVYMSTSVSRRLNILCIKLKIREFFITKLITHLDARVRILLVCGKHLHGRTIPLREEAWDIKLLQLRLKQAIHESERSCICMSEVMYMYVRGHVYVCQRSCICMSEVSILPSLLQFLDWILRLFRQCRIFSLFLILVDNQNLLSKEYFFDKILG